MARQRDYYAERQAANRKAQDLGYRNPKERTRYRNEAANKLGLTGRRDSASSAKIEAYAQFQRDFTKQDWTGRVGELKDDFVEFFGYYDDEDFYDWVDELYGE